MERGTFKLDPTSSKILSTVLPKLQQVINRAVETTTVPFAIVSGNRTAEEQKKLYAQGRPWLPYGRQGMKITWTLHSNHMGGGAIDFSAVDEHGKPSNMDPKTWNSAHYKPIADVIKAAGAELGIPVYWGFDMWKKDFGHIQLKRQ